MDFNSIHARRNLRPLPEGILGHQALRGKHKTVAAAWRFWPWKESGSFIRGFWGLRRFHVGRNLSEF